MLRTLGKTTWKKVKINEVFACKAKFIGWIIIYKETESDARDLAINDNFFVEETGLVFEWTDYSDPLYKLPKSVQKLFKEE